MKIIFILFGLCFIIEAYTQQSSLDNSFGENGKVITYFDDGAAQSTDAARQNDNKIIVAGTFISNEGNQSFMVIRYLEDGQIDNSFGINGRVITDLGYDVQQASSIAVQEDGKIILAGSVVSGMFGTYHDVALVRYNTDGTIDLTFGKNGIVISDFLKDDYAYSIALQEDGKVVIAGNNQSQYFLVARYLPNGNLDNSFGNNGYVTTALSGLAFAKTVSIQPDGNIIAAGETAGSFALVRYLINGSLDATFGDGGKVKTNFPSYRESISDIVLQKDNKILAAGTEGEFAGGNMTVVRYTPEGKIDSSFGVSGKTTLIIDTLSSVADVVEVQEDGKIILIGNTKTMLYGYGMDFTVAKLQSDGNKDVSFGNEGIVRTDFGPYSESAVGGFLDNDGKIVVAGRSNDFVQPSRAMVLLARYNNDGVKPVKYVRIKKWLHHHGFTWEDKPDRNISYYSIQRSNSNNAFNEIAKLFNSSNQRQYSYEDATLLSGDNYYRVAAVSADGSTNYSNIVAINNGETFIKVYPNPAKNNLHIEGLSATAKTTLTVTDINGNKSISTTIISNAYNLNVSQLKQGGYFLKIESKGNVVVKKFVKE